MATTQRTWVSVGGDLEASYDGLGSVDIRPKRRGAKRAPRVCVFMSKAALLKAASLIPRGRKSPPGVTLSGAIGG